MLVYIRGFFSFFRSITPELRQLNRTSNMLTNSHITQRTQFCRFKYKKKEEKLKKLLIFMLIQ